MDDTRTTGLPQWNETNYFLIDGKYYDLTNFLDKHPGGRNILKYTKQLVYDATIPFSMHHVNFELAYSMLQNYEITDTKLIEKCKLMIKNVKLGKFHKQNESKRPLKIKKQYITHSRKHSRKRSKNAHNNDYISARETRAQFVSEASQIHGITQTETEPEAEEQEQEQEQEPSESRSQSIFSESESINSNSSQSSNDNDARTTMYDDPVFDARSNLAQENGTPYLKTNAEYLKEMIFNPFLNTNKKQVITSGSGGLSDSVSESSGESEDEDDGDGDDGDGEDIEYVGSDGQYYNNEDLKPMKYNHKLPDKNSFYYELRKEAYLYFKKNKINTGPTKFALNYWWSLLTIYIISVIYNFYFVNNYIISNNNGNGFTFSELFLNLNGWDYHIKFLFRITFNSIICGILLVWLGGYGHQWVHMTKYRRHAFILDWIGLYSHSFRKEHTIQHHSYTNTIADNHFDGTDPFLLVNPLIKRNLIQTWLVFLYSNVILSVGTFGNYLFNIMRIIKGKEDLRWFFLLLPLKALIYCCATKSFWTGAILFCVETMTVSWYYFVIALMNHNQKQSWDLDRIRNCHDWGEMQLAVACDIGYNYNWIQSMFCLWLNYHTVHHLLPTTDMSHHQNLQIILSKVSRKHGLQYNYKPLWTMYFDMLRTFSIARALNEMR